MFQLHSESNLELNSMFPSLVAMATRSETARMRAGSRAHGLERRYNDGGWVV